MRQAYTELGEHPLHETRAIPAGRSIASRHIRIALELQSIVGQCLTSGTRRSRRNAADVGTFGRTAGSPRFSLRLCLSLSRLCLSLSFSLSLLLSLSVLFRRDSVWGTSKLSMPPQSALDSTSVDVCSARKSRLAAVVFGKERVAVTVVSAIALPAFAAGTAAPNEADTATTAKILVKRLAIFIVFEATINVPLQQNSKTTRTVSYHATRRRDHAMPKNRTASAY